jgi:Ser/Thr protein kinase RdoA (MazF antagonist)
MDLEHARAAMAHYPLAGDVALTAFGDGLINQTFRVTADEGSFVLQRLNPVFDPAIHRNIAAVTARLAECGVPTPRLVPTLDGALWAEHRGATWRLMNLVPGASFSVVQSAAQARSAAALVARFHRALEGLDHTFVGLRVGVHDTAAHVGRLREALVEHREHALFGVIDTLAAELLAAIEGLPPLGDVPRRICHGDLKFNNLMFEAAEPPGSERATCLIDLDTLAPMPLAHELGDAWRSWCNRSPEDAEEARFDLEVFRASWEGYASAWGEPLDEIERRSLLHGIEWISVELAVRFAADALAESYFGWDAARYGTRGEHNLARARGQWALHRAVLATRGERARVLAL